MLYKTARAWLDSTDQPLGRPELQGTLLLGLEREYSGDGGVGRREHYSRAHSQAH